MEYDQRDEVWNASWLSYYEAYYQELLAERLVLRWQRLDEFSKVLIALTASSSALSGWALWNEPGFRLLWLIIAGFGAILAIVHKSLDVPRKLTDWSSSRSQFSVIRIEFENVLNRMRINPNFPVEVLSKSLLGLRARYAEAYQKTQVDAFLTFRLRSKVQAHLDSLVSDNK